jgi:hypothetical protein
MLSNGTDRDGDRVSLFAGLLLVRKIERVWHDLWSLGGLRDLGGVGGKGCTGGDGGN